MSGMSTDAVLVLSESAQVAMVDAANRAYPQETGGILIGAQLDGQPWATRAVELATPDRGLHHYKLPAGATQPAVRAARREDWRLGYLGDWHTHPFDIGPSFTDLTTLARFSVRHPRSPNPTLVVVRRSPTAHVLDARRIIALTLRFCEVRLTGDLPTPLATADDRPRLDPTTEGH